MFVSVRRSSTTAAGRPPILATMASTWLNVDLLLEVFENLREGVAVSR